MAAVVLTIHLLLAVSLIIVVLLQRSEGGGLGIGGGSGGGIMTGRGAATALSKMTWILGTAFVVTSLSLTIIAAQDASTDSVIEDIGAGTETTAPASLPPLGGDLLPPTPDTDNPSTPPASDGPAPPPPAE
jgi:preprotein translocase subunit SecG